MEEGSRITIWFMSPSCCLRLPERASFPMLCFIPLCSCILRHCFFPLHYAAMLCTFDYRSHQSTNLTVVPWMIPLCGFQTSVAKTGGIVSLKILHPVRKQYFHIVFSCWRTIFGFHLKNAGKEVVLTTNPQSSICDFDHLWTSGTMCVHGKMKMFYRSETLIWSKCSLYEWISIIGWIPHNALVHCGAWS